MLGIGMPKSVFIFAKCMNCVRQWNNKSNWWHTLTGIEGEKSSIKSSTNLVYLNGNLAFYGEGFFLLACWCSYKNGMYNKKKSYLNSLDCLFIFITVKRKVGKDSSSDATGPPRNPKYSQVLLPFSNSVPTIRNKIS